MWLTSSATGRSTRLPEALHPPSPVRLAGKMPTAHTASTATPFLSRRAGISDTGRKCRSLRQQFKLPEHFGEVDVELRRLFEHQKMTDAIKRPVIHLRR